MPTPSPPMDDDELDAESLGAERQRLRARSKSQRLYLSDVGNMGTVLYNSDPKNFRSTK